MGHERGHDSFKRFKMYFFLFSFFLLIKDLNGKREKTSLSFTGMTRVETGLGI